MRLDAARLKREARHILWGWAILVGISGTIGGIIGFVGRESDGGS